MTYFARSSNPLDLLGSMQNLLPLLLALGAWLIATWKKLKRSDAAAEPAAADEAERTRRVQEEVRRKIAERRGRRSGEDAATGAPAAGTPARSARGEGWRGLMERREVPPLDSFGGPNRSMAKPAQAPERLPPAGLDDPQVLERQRWLAEQASVLDAAARRSAAGIAQAAQSTPLPVISPWLAELREPASVRRAILLREILGVPAGLR